MHALGTERKKNTLHVLCPKSSAPGVILGRGQGKFLKEQDWGWGGGGTAQWLRTPDAPLQRGTFLPAPTWRSQLSGTPAPGHLMPFSVLCRYSAHMLASPHIQFKIMLSRRGSLHLH